MIKLVLSSFLLIQILTSITFGQQWQPLNTDSVLVEHLTSLYFTSPETGFVVGCDPTQSSWSSNVLYRTTDGGSTWNYAGGSEMCMPLIYFFNSTIGYFITRGSANDADAMKKTTDGGNTWTIITAKFSNNDRKGIFFIDENTGYYGGGDGFYIYKTKDGGNTWTAHATGSNSSIIDAIWFRDKDTGFIAGWYGAKIAKTTDGGETWADVSNQYSVYSMQFPSASTGYAVASNLSNKPVIIKTSDGGNSWNTVYTLPGSNTNRPQYFSSVYCMDVNTCLAVGDSGTILKTTDAGNTWFNQVSGTTKRLNSVFCIDNKCFAAGDSSTLLKASQEIGTGVSADEEAQVGIAVYPNPASNILSIKFPNEAHASEIKMINVLNEPVLYQNVHNIFKAELDVSNLNSGIYFLQVQSGNNFFISKFIKQ